MFESPEEVKEKHFCQHIFVATLCCAIILFADNYKRDVAQNITSITNVTNNLSNMSTILK